jgi:energy-coupling factor transport system ATP-binding protein
MIELKNITVSLPHGRTTASTILDDITLNIEDGEWVMLTGPNGSGKTTLLKTIAGLLPADSGTLTINGEASPARLRTALLLQEPDNQFVASSVRSELLLSLPPQMDDGSRNARLSRAVEQFSLSEFLDRNPHRLSGGEKQRLAFATVWLSAPDLLLLDEPTSYLDEVESERCLRFVEDLNQTGVSVVWAAPEADHLTNSQRVVHIDHGRIDSDGVSPEAAVTDRQPVGGVMGKDTGGSVLPTTPVRPGTGASVVSMRSVTFAYGERPVLDNLSVELRKGECAVVLGRNGSGKSTLLGLLSGVLKPTRGELVRFYKRAVQSGCQNVFYLFQSPERLFFAETVFEELAFGLKALKIPKPQIAERVDEALTRVALSPEAFRDRMPFSLSLGEMRRLAFAIALALEPRFLLLDEPASCLDASGRQILFDLIRYFKGEGRTVVIASHDTGMFADLADRVIEL